MQRKSMMLVAAIPAAAFIISRRLIPLKFLVAFNSTLFIAVPRGFRS